jgi:porphobilinogen deaminase
MSMQDVHVDVEKGACVGHCHVERESMPEKVVGHLEMLPIRQDVEERVRYH